MLSFFSNIATHYLNFHPLPQTYQFPFHSSTNRTSFLIHSVPNYLFIMESSLLNPTITEKKCSRCRHTLTLDMFGSFKTCNDCRAKSRAIYHNRNSHPRKRPSSEFIHEDIPSEPNVTNIARLGYFFHSDHHELELIMLQFSFAPKYHT